MNALSRQVPTIAALRAIGKPRQAATVFVSGVDGIFKFSSSSTDDDNGSSIVKPETYPSRKPGRWILSLIGLEGSDISARAYTSDTQSIPGGDVDTQVELDTKTYDTDSLWNEDGQKFVVQTPGKYLVAGGAILAGSGGALPDFELQITVNDEVVAGANSHKHDTDEQPLSAHYLGLLEQGDEIKLVVAQDTAIGHGAINLEAGAWLAVQRVDKASGDHPRPACYLTRDQDLEVAASEYADVTFSVERYDRGDFHDLLANTERATIPEDGEYDIQGGVSWDYFLHDAESGAWLLLVLNGDTIDLAFVPAKTDDFPRQKVAALGIPLEAGDVVSLLAYQDSPDTVKILAAGRPDPAHLSVRKVN